MEQAFRIEEAELIRFVQELVRVRSVNPPGDEEAAARLVEARLRSFGFETTWVPYGPNRAHVVGRLRGAAKVPGLLFSGHVDVVPPGETAWDHDPFGAEIVDGRLYGRGACDMKSGVAALVFAAGALARSGRPLNGDLVVAITADEEAGCRGAEHLVKEPLFDGVGAALIAEPSALQLYVAEKGAFWLEVVFFGKTAHGSMPDQGENAIDHMAQFLTRLPRLFPSDLPPHPILGRPTLNVGTVAGGVKINVVPDRCVAALDMRTIPGQRHADIRTRVEAMAGEVAAGHPRARVEVKTLVDREPVSSPPDSPLANAVAAAVESVTGTRPRPGGVPYFTDACVFAPVLNIPMVICGPGLPSMAHQPDEYVEVRQVAQAAEVFARAAAALLCDPGS
jgi:succinyl-diaminopimelate desuccinylase